MHRLWTDNGPIHSRQLFAVLVMLLCLGVGNAWGATFTKITSLSDLTTGDYVIVGRQGSSSWGKLVYGSLSSGKLTYSSDYSSLPSSITTTTANEIWHLTVSGTGTTRTVTIYNAGQKKYLKGNGSLSFQNDAENWTAAYSSGFRLLGTKESNYLGVNKDYNYWRDYASGTLYNSNTYCLTLYKAPSGFALTFKETGGSSNGSGLAAANATSMTISTAPTPATGKMVEGYYAENTLTTKVANADGSWAANNITGWVTSGKFTKGTAADLYIKWTDLVTTLTLDKGTDGTTDGTATITYNATSFTSKTDATKTGYHLSGYYTLATGGSKVINADGSLVSSLSGWTSSGKWVKNATTATLYAQWTIDTYTVHWKVNGNDWEGSTHGSPSTSANYNTKPSTIPTAPASSDCDNSKVFVGWTATPIVGTTNTFPSDLFYTKEAAPNITGNTTFYAVFATGGVATFNSSTLSGLTEDDTYWSWTHDASGTVFDLYGDYSSRSNNIWVIGYGSSGTYGEITAPASSYLANVAITLSAASNKVVSVTQGTLTTNSTAQNVVFRSAQSSTQLKPATSSTQTKITNMVITYVSSTPAFATTCCTPLGSINGSVSWTNPTQAVVTWDKLDDQVSAWALSWSPNTAGSSITSAIADYGLTQKTATVSGLACGTEYTFTLTPTLKSGVCTPASNPTIESTSTKYSITKASVSEGSFTTKISSDAVTSACNGSTISIAATPNTGYSFSSWTITNDDDDDDDVTSTLLGVNSTTSPTSFTMPSHRVTITPSFSCIEPEIGTNPASASYTEGASPSALTVAATLSSGTLTYKWQKSTNSGVSWTDESGTGYNTATYAAANISTSLSANGVQYRCIVGNSEGGCTVTSGVATITVTAASQCVAPTFDPVAGTYNSSQTVTISSSTSGSTIYYTTNGSTPTTSSSHGTEGEASASVTVSSSMTLKAIAYKGGMTTSDVSDAAYVICSTDPTFSTTSSSNITITGARVTCAGITKGTCDIDAYGIVYGTSEHPTGNAQQKGTDASTNVSSYYVDLTGLTAATTYYARPYATVNGKTVYGTEISFTTLHIPEITVSVTSRAFGTRKVAGSYEMTFTVSGAYLQGNIGLAISGTNSAMFSVDETSLTPSTGTVGSTTVTVTYTPSAAGSHSATVSITSTNATTKTVTLSGTGQYEDTYMTAMHEGVDAWEDYATGVTQAGTGYDVPNPGDIEAGDREGTGCEGIHYHFAGWVEETYKASPSGHIVAASGTKDASNKTFWAVWEKEKAGSGSLTKLTSAYEPTEGDNLVIVAKGTTVALYQSTYSTNYVQKWTFDNDIETVSADDKTYVTLESDGEDGWYLGDATNGYLYGDNGNDLAVSKSDKLAFTFGTEVVSDVTYFTFNSGRWLSYRSDITTTYYRLGGSKAKASEASGNALFDLYKYVGISYEDPKVECVCSADPVAGTAEVDAEGTFSASSIAVKATDASTGHADCSYTDYGFVWSSSVSAAAELKLVEGTGAAATNCVKVQVGTSGEVTSFTGSLTGSFTANNPIYVRSYVKNGKAAGTYQYSSVVTITPRSVTFNLNGHGSSAPAAQFVNNGSKATDPSYAESVTGYIFGGWYKEVGCTNLWNFATDVVSGESKTLYAKWTPISYSVRFNDNDENYLGTATGSMSNQSFDYDEEKALTTNTFSLAGYDFAGWATTPTGDVAHLDEAEVENLSSTNGATVDLYAIWTAKKYNVTLAATNETSSVGSQTVQATYNAAMPLVTTADGTPAVAAPSRTGYTFTGWEYSSTTYYNYNAGTSTLSSAHVWDQPNSTTTLTPKWSINSYTLTWDLTGGTVSVAGTGAEEGATGTPSSSVVYNSAITVPTVTKAGYNFVGWDVTPASNMPASNVTYTATWTAKTLNSISLAEASVSVYVGEIKYVNVIFDPTDILSKAFGQVAAPSYCVLSSYDSYNKLKITGGRAGADISVNRTETVSIKYTADETKTASISVTVKPLPTVTFVDLIHNKSDFANSGDGYTAATGVLISTVTTGVVSHAKKTPTHTDVPAPVGGNACETGHLHLMGWIRSDYSKVADYMNGTGEAPSVSDLTTAGAEYWFLPDADINTETYNGKTFYAVWAVEE